jgi:hypothetical protein
MWYTILITLVVDLGGLLIVFLVLRDRVRRATSTDSRISEIRDEVSRLLVELNQATDRNIALMEDKISALNEVISTADKKIGLLRRETEKHDVGSQIYTRLAEGKPRAAAESPRFPAVPAADAAVPQPVVSLAVELSESGGADSRAPDARQRVMMLYRAGFSPSLIASRVGSPLGEVELIIALEQRKGTA